jgi:HSP20 family protein
MPLYRPLSGAGFAYPLDELRDELDRLWTSLTAAPPLHGWGVRPGSDTFPAVNVSESDDCVTIEAELPGLDAGDVDIAVSGEELVLKGARPEPHQPADPAAAGTGAAASPGNGERHQAVTWHRRERGTGSFERRIMLPIAVDSSRVEAKLVDGVLTITCPKAPERQPHKVTVRTG